MIANLTSYIFMVNGGLFFSTPGHQKVGADPEEAVYGGGGCPPPISPVLIEKFTKHSR